LRGAERDRGLFSAARAGGLGFDLGVTVILALGWRCAEDGDPLGLAGFATLGFVFELLVVKEKLLPGGENKITPTVDTLQHLVLKFHLRMAPFSLFPLAIAGNCGGRRKHRLSYIPLGVTPGLGPSRLWNEDVATNYRAFYAGE